MKFSIPCSPSSATQDYNETPPESDLTTDITVPTAGEYAGVTAREFLSVLGDVAQQVPVPGFDAIVKVASNIVKACDDSQATLARADDLKVRIKTLVAIFVNELKGKKKGEIHAKLLHDIESLKQDMNHIQKTLEKISSQHRILLVFFRGVNDDRVNKCVIKLNNSLESFNVARNIDFTDMLKKLEQQITMFYDQNQGRLQILQQGMDHVIAMLNERGSENSISSSLSRTSIPTASAIFHGRSELVAELVEIIKNPAHHKHICLLGPGGMGKTSTSLAVMSDPGVKACFAEHLRVWVPCVKATSVAQFFDTLQLSLAVTKRKGDVRADILAELNSSPPIIIVLDNFETPWNAEGAQSEIESILHDIGQQPAVTLFITMRSSAPPCGDLLWHCVDLQAVDMIASRQIYSSWCFKGSNDPDVPQLLDLIGHVPLAVTLMAKLANTTHLSAADLVNEYNHLGTSILGQGSDATSSMNHCISLSVNSPRMKAHPEALDLLYTLSILPTGTSYKMLHKWWACNLLNLVSALDVLKSVSLIEERDGIYFVLPVIQRYILDPSHFYHNILVSMINAACIFLKQHKSEIGDPMYQDHVAAISAEEGNLEAVLLKVTDSDPHIIQDGHLLLAQYQRNNRPRVDVIEHGLNLISGINAKLLYGDLLYCKGLITRDLNQDHDGLQYFQEALHVFLSVNNASKAAICRLEISDNSEVQYLESKALIHTAQAEFESIDDEVGFGRSLICVSDLELQYPYSESLNCLNQAEAIFAKHNKLYWHAITTSRLAYIYDLLSQYNNAYSWASASLNESRSIGFIHGCWIAANSLGYISLRNNDYDASLQYFFQCLQVRKSMQLAPYSVALEGMGMAWIKLGKIIDAHRAFKEALEQFSLNSFGYYRNQFLIKQLENPELKPNANEKQALEWSYAKGLL